MPTPKAPQIFSALKMLTQSHHLFAHCKGRRGAGEQFRAGLADLSETAEAVLMVCSQRRQKTLQLGISLAISEVYAGIKPGSECRPEVLDVSLLGFWVQTRLLKQFLLQTLHLSKGAGNPHLLALGNLKLLQYFCSLLSLGFC